MSNLKISSMIRILCALNSSILAQLFGLPHALLNKEGPLALFFSTYLGSLHGSISHKQVLQ